MAEILTQVLQPDSVGDQRNFRLDDDQVFGVPSRSYLHDQEGTGIRRPRGLDPRVHDRTREEKLGFHPDALLRRSTVLTDKGLHLDAVRAVSFSHFDRIWESEAPAEPLHFPQITDWLGRSLALPRE